MDRSVACANSVYWDATAPQTSFPPLSGDLSVDVAVIGGGIVGLTTARLLKDRGLSVAVIEARRVGRQVTGKSTAKVSSQHGIRYQTIARTFGEDKAQLYADAQQAGLAKIIELARHHGIDADLETMPAYVWTEDEDWVDRLKKEVEIARRLGLPASLEGSEIGLPFPVKGAMRFADQAQFHPVKYLAGLAATIPGDGCHVFEQSRVFDYDPTGVKTDAGSVKARHVVMATHLPLGQVGLYYAMTSPHAEPLLAAPIARIPQGMYVNAEEPGRSIRTHRHEGTLYGIATGPSFKPGNPDDERDCVRGLEQWLIDRFATGPIEYRWINEDYSAMDGAPLVGWSSSIGSGYLVATGFAAWGVTNGTAAAMIIADLATGRDNDWLALFDATRVKPVAGAKEFAKGNAQVAAHLVSGYLARKPKSYDDLQPGDAAIMKIDGDNIAAFKDEAGTVHAVSAVCSHMGCLVGWNATDRTWDCPCHGSRFELSGEVLHGPATRPLGSGITG